MIICPPHRCCTVSSGFPNGWGRGRLMHPFDRDIDTRTRRQPERWRENVRDQKRQEASVEINRGRTYGRQIGWGVRVNLEGFVCKVTVWNPEKRGIVRRIGWRCHGGKNNVGTCLLHFSLFRSQHPTNICPIITFVITRPSADPPVLAVGVFLPSLEAAGPFGRGRGRGRWDCRLIHWYRERKVVSRSNCAINRSSRSFPSLSFQFHRQSAASSFAASRPLSQSSPKAIDARNQPPGRFRACTPPLFYSTVLPNTSTRRVTPISASPAFLRWLRIHIRHIAKFMAA